jgi:hypothetical protein
LVKALQQLTDFQRITTTADNEGMFHTPHSAHNEHPPLDAVPRTDTVEWRDDVMIYGGVGTEK